MSGLFITGIGTDVGKTFVTATIFKQLYAENHPLLPVKPIQTGATKRADGGWNVPDLDFYLKAAELNRDDLPYDKLYQYCYEPACSPHLAARMVKHYPEIAPILEQIKELKKDGFSPLVEGAGGVMVPINETTTMLDLMIILQLPILLVANLELGTINQTLLTIQAIRKADLSPIGIIFTETKKGNEASAFIRNDNPRAIKQFSNIKILGVIPFIDKPTLPEQCQEASKYLNWDAIKIHFP